MRLPIRLGAYGHEYPVLLLRVSDVGLLLCATPALDVNTPVSLTLAAGEPDELVGTGMVARQIGRDALVIELAPGDAIRGRFATPPPVAATQPTRRMIRPILSSLRRVCERAEPASTQPILMGAVAELGLPALLGWLEYTERSGRLEVTHGENTITLHLDRGRIVEVGSLTLSGGVRELLFGLLGWSDGAYTLWPAAQTFHQRGLSITQLLIDHASEG